MHKIGLQNFSCNKEKFLKKEMFFSFHYYFVYFLVWDYKNELVTKENPWQYLILMTELAQIWMA